MENLFNLLVSLPENMQNLIDNNGNSFARPNLALNLGPKKEKFRHVHAAGEREKSFPPQTIRGLSTQFSTIHHRNLFASFRAASQDFRVIYSFFQK